MTPAGAVTSTACPADGPEQFSLMDHWASGRQPRGLLACGFSPQLANSCGPAWYACCRGGVRRIPEKAHRSRLLPRWGAQTQRASLPPSAAPAGQCLWSLHSASTQAPSPGHGLIHSEGKALD